MPVQVTSAPATTPPLARRSPGPAQGSGRRSGGKKRAARIRRYWQLYVLLALPMAFLTAFNYWPMLGAQIAFRNYNPVQGIWGSPWVGLSEMKFFVEGPFFWPILQNTLVIGFYYLLVSIPATLILALAINEVKHARFKKVAQMVSYAPYFISVVVLVSIMQIVLSPQASLLTKIAGIFGIHNVPDFFGSPGAFPSLYVWSGVWQESGYGAIIYLAALSAVSPHLYEAARIDGASRLRRIWHVDLPSIRPTIVILVILGVGTLINVSFEKAYLLQTPLNLSTSEIISTYVYKQGIQDANFSFAAAVGLFNSIVSFFLLVVSNGIARLFTGEGLF
ncbi:MAG TPA: ABC transporter permease subunit [Acidimicrobiales bacterium]|nr:ABC transporter permease subunit [Acidimicrobiales bacterium]